MTTHPNTSAHHTPSHIVDQMQGLVDALRQEMVQTSEPQAKVLYQTSIEVLRGVLKAFAEWEPKENAQGETHSHQGWPEQDSPLK